MSEMIERVAAAIDPAAFSGEAVQPYWELWVKDRQAKARRLAKTVIKAMREPTEDMRLEGESRATSGIGHAVDDDAVPKVWRGMIDVALKD